MKRGFDRLLAEGKGKQLVWLLCVTVIVLTVAIGIALLCYNDLYWQQVVAVMLDPGCYGNSGWKFDGLLIPLAVFSLVVLSGLLVSTITNVVENISESVRNGKRRYDFKNHILIVGCGRQLEPMLKELAKEGYNESNVIVMSETRPEVDGSYTYYCGSRISVEDLRSARPEFATKIYIIGEDNEPEHDAKSLQAIDILKGLTKEAKNEIRCYMTLEDRVSSEVYEYLTEKVEGKLLLVDVINYYEYQAELLMIDSKTELEFLPTIKSGDKRRSHIVIFGNNHIAQNVAYTAAHISHYPNYTECGAKTCITFIGEDMRRKMDSIIAARQALFDMSVYRYVNANGEATEHNPTRDYLDVEWEFIDTYDASSLARRTLCEINAADDEILTIVVADDNPHSATKTVLHLPREVYGNNIAVYMEDSADIIELSRKTKIYGNIRVFGSATGVQSDPLFEHRSIRGQRVNFVYDQAYGNPPSATAEEAWYKIPESHKYSSIYSAMAMPMRMRCFDMDGDRRPIYEAEHRRWMMSELIMGYSYAPVRDKAKFPHNDIIPFDELPASEQDKDKILIDAMKNIVAE